MKSFFIIFLLICYMCTPASAQQWCGTQTAFFQHAVSEDIPGYEELINFPSGDTERDENVTITSTSGPVLIDTYITPLGSPSVSQINSGLRRYRTFMYVNTASGTTRLNFTPFFRFANGTETNIYTVMTDDINDLTVNEYLTSYTVPFNEYIDPTTRWGIRVTANTTQPSPVTVHWVYEGVTHYSSVDSGFFVCETDSVISNSMASNELPLSPIIGIMAIAIIGLIFFRKRGNL